MRIHTFLAAMGLIAAMAVTFTPAQAGLDIGNLLFGKGGYNRPAPTAPAKDDTLSPAEMRAYQSWFKAQVRDYNYDDDVTGERLSELLQMVTEVQPSRLMVSDP